MNKQALNKLKRDWLMKERFQELYGINRLRLDDVYETLSKEFCIDKDQIQRRLNDLNEKIELAQKHQIKLDFLEHAKVSDNK